MHNSKGELFFSEEQKATIRRLNGKISITEIARTLKCGYIRTKREMFKMGLVSDFKEPAPKEKISVEFFDYANEYSYK